METMQEITEATNTITLEGHSDDVLHVKILNGSKVVFDDELYELPFKFRIGKFEFVYDFTDKFGWNISSHIFNEDMIHTPFDIHYEVKSNGYAPIVRIKTFGKIETELFSVKTRVIKLLYDLGYPNHEAADIFENLFAQKLLIKD